MTEIKANEFLCSCYAPGPAEPTEYRPGDGPYWAQRMPAYHGDMWQVWAEDVVQAAMVGCVGAIAMVDEHNRICRDWAAKQAPPHPYIHRLLEVIIGKTPSMPEMTMAGNNNVEMRSTPCSDLVTVTCGECSAKVRQNEIWLHYDNGTIKNAGTGIVYHEGILDD